MITKYTDKGARDQVPLSGKGKETSTLLTSLFGILFMTKIKTSLYWQTVNLTEIKLKQEINSSYSIHHKIVLNWIQ